MGRKKLEIDAIEVVRMHDEEGKTYKEIAKYYTNKGISVSIPTIGIYYKEGCKLLGKEPQDGRENRQIPGEEKEEDEKMELKRNLRLISYLKEQKNMPYTKIAERLKQLGLVEPNVSIQELTILIEQLYREEGRTPHTNSASLHEEISLHQKGFNLDEIEQKVNLERNEIVRRIVYYMLTQGKRINAEDILLRDAILKGKTIPAYTQKEEVQRKMIEALNRIKGQKQHNNFSYQDLEKVLRYMEGKEGFAHVHNCEIILSAYPKKGRLPTGQIEVLQNRYFPENPLEFTYIFIRFCRKNAVILSETDKDVLFAYRKRLANNVDRAIETRIRISHTTDFETKDTQDEGVR